MDTLSLFDTEGRSLTTDKESLSKGEMAYPEIIGLTYVPSFVSKGVETKLMAALEQQPWIGDLKRRVQHYGYRYNYTSRRIDESMRVGDVPIWLVNIGKRMVKRGYLEEIPDQVIVNEYLPGQGIAPHIDCEPCFGDRIASLSLGSACYMDFTRPETGEKVPVWLEPRSLVVLQEDARYVWRHSIAKRVSDMKDGKEIERSRRVSLTFRKVRAEWLTG